MRSAPSSSPPSPARAPQARGRRLLAGPLGRLLLLLGGVALLGLGAWRALHFQPFHSAPPLAPAPARGAPELPVRRAAALAIQPQESAPPWLHTITRGIPTPPLDQTENLLLAGIDTRPWKHGGRTDALVVLLLHRESGHVGLVSIPRDLLVAIPGHPPDRINTVYATGQREGGAERGVSLLKEVVRHSLGLPVEHVLFVDHAGFEELVDTLGGVGVQVACPIADRFIDPRGPGGRLELRLERGLNHLDGKTALMFARSRHGRGIFDRARRQQALLLALRDRVSELGLPRLGELLPALRRTVYTDLDALELLALARRLSQVERQHIHGLVLGPQQCPPTVLEDGRWVVVAQPEALVKGLSELFSARRPGFRAPHRRCPPMDIALQPRKHRTNKTNRASPPQSTPAPPAAAAKAPAQPRGKASPETS